jgi:hypothetical protein
MCVLNIPVPPPYPYCHIGNNIEEFVVGEVNMNRVEWFVLIPVTILQPMIVHIFFLLHYEVLNELVLCDSRNLRMKL